MAETEIHRELLVALIDTLKQWYASDKTVCVSGNLLVFYEEGDKRKHVSPDVFVVPGVGDHERDNYLMWEEGRGLDLVIELTSKTTRKEDTNTKRKLYRSKLGVQEYFLFDPREEYLTPSFQGFHRVGNRFQPIKAVDGRLPSQVLGLHLARDGRRLRFYNPLTGLWLPTTAEVERARAEAAEAQAAAAQAQAVAAEARAETERTQKDAERERAEAERVRADAAEVEMQRMREELDRLRRAIGGGTENV
jgi:Uma2 family endonuclease